MNSKGVKYPMSTQITLTLPDDIYKKAENFAQLTNRDINDILTQVITISLSPISSQPISNKSSQNNAANSISIKSLSDEEVVALTGSEMEPEQDQRLSELLYNQQAGTLVSTEYSELNFLMQIYQEKLLVKAQALHEAVERRLREPLEVV